MINQSLDHCCGCGACMAICPKAAIAMQEDGCGYTYPSVDHAKCIECGLCERICPEITHPDLSAPLSVYAACSGDGIERISCASGGAATVLGRAVIRRGGVVYGCSQKNYRTIRHIRVDREEALNLLKGSKYVQSDMTGIYAEVQNDLLSGRMVLFVGTPCQGGALRRYLRKQYANLCIVDLVCHGVPSQSMLRRSVEEVLNSTEDVFVNFRWKTQFGIQFGIQFGEKCQIVKTVPAAQSAYMTAFLSGLSYRENCHRCQYSRHERVGDITIGDFWDLGKDSPSGIDPRGGVSLVMVNTDLGMELWKLVEESFTAEKRTFEEAVKYNWNLHDPSPRPAAKDKFLEMYPAQGMEAAVRACSRRYRIETTPLIRFVRRVPILNHAAGMAKRFVRKIF